MYPLSSIFCFGIEISFNTGEGLYSGYGTLGYDGDLNWLLTDEWVVSQPTFNNVVNGESYPILHLYENFGYVDLLIAASDRDRGAELSVITTLSNPTMIEVSTLNQTSYRNLQGIPFNIGFRWGSTDDGIVNEEYKYPTPWYTFIDDYEATTEINNLAISSGDNQYIHGDISHINSIIRLSSLKDKVGTVDIAMRVIDQHASIDKVVIRVVIHPINDPPVIEALSDTEVFMNSENYPNDELMPSVEYELNNLKDVQSKSDSLNLLVKQK